MGLRSNSAEDAASHILDMSFEGIRKIATDAKKEEVLAKEAQLRSILNSSYDDFSALRENTLDTIDDIDTFLDLEKASLSKSVETSAALDTSSPLDHSEDKALLAIQHRFLSMKNLSLYVYSSLLVFGLLFLLFSPIDDDPKPLIS